MNVYTIKKWLGLLLPTFFGIAGFIIGVLYYNMLYAIMICIIILAIFSIIGNLLLRNPFTQLLEGKGILMMDINSTGVLQPIIVHVEQPYVKGKIANRKIEDVFDRDSVMAFANPVLSEKMAYVDENNNIFIKLDKNQYNQARWGLMQYPVIIYNSILDTIMTKDVFSNLEKSTFAEHIVLYLNRKLDELSMYLRDFGRYIVEQTKPQDKWWQNKWVKWIAIGGVVILIIVLLPKIINIITGSGTQSAVSAVSSALPTNAPISPITPTG